MLNPKNIPTDENGRIPQGVKNRKESQAFEIKFPRSDYVKLRHASMRGGFNWNFDYEDSTEIFHVSCSDYYIPKADRDLGVKGNEEKKIIMALSQILGYDVTSKLERV